MRAAKHLAVAVFFTLLASQAQAGWVSQESGTTQDLNAVCFASDSLAFCVGNNGTLLKTTNGGVTWESKTSGTTATLNDVIVPGATELYAAGNGTVLKSTDNGETFTALTIPAAVATANFVQGSYYGLKRAIAASNGTAADSQLLVSTDGGSSWTTSALTNLNVSGVYLSSAGNTYAWGQYFGGADSGKYAIIRDGTAVWTGTAAVRDLVMTSFNYGYAVGSSGQVLKTSNGGSSWSAVTSGLAANLNAVSFINDNFGWVAGEGGTIALTSNSAAAWNSYDLGATPNLKDINIRLTGGGGSTVSVQGHVCGAGGKIYELQSPMISGVTPTAKKAGWAGTLEVSGTGFIYGGYATLEGSGRTGVTMFSTSFESATRLRTYIILTPEATVGPWDVRVTNGDATVSTATGLFTVQTREAVVVIDNVWFGAGASRSKYLPGGTVSRDDVLSFEAYSTYNMPRAARILAQVGGSWTAYELPASAISQTSANTIEVAYRLELPATAMGRDARLILYVEDANGNPQQKPLALKIASSSGDIPDTYVPPAGAAPGAIGFTGIETPNWDPEDPATPSVKAFVRLADGVAVSFIDARLLDMQMREVWRERISFDVPATNKINLAINKAELSPDLTAGAYVLIVHDDRGRLVAKNIIFLVPKALKR